MVINLEPLCSTEEVAKEICHFIEIISKSEEH
jgi:hypothetical protein